jgi:hypothetical protein
VAIASACPEPRKLIVAKVSKPTARIVNKTISVSVITNAKPLVRIGLGAVFMADSGIAGTLNAIHIVLTKSVKGFTPAVSPHATIIFSP